VAIVAFGGGGDAAILGASLDAFRYCSYRLRLDRVTDAIALILGDRARIVHCGAGAIADFASRGLGTAAVV
jgi:hypothetical protein